MSEYTVVYITGAGKCGTHLVGSYIAANCPNTYVYPKEFKSWKEELLASITPGKNFVFHRPGTELDAFWELIPHGQVIILLRNPVQQYLSWVSALHNRVISKRSYRDPRLGAKSVFHLALQRIVRSFQLAGDATQVWRLEDFTRSPKDRISRISSILPVRDCPTDHIKLPLKTNYLPLTGVHQVTETDYTDPIAKFEIDALMVHDELFVKYYPNWKQSIHLSEQPAGEVLKKRFQRILLESRSMKKSRDKRRQRAVQSFLRGRPKPIIRYLIKDIIRYPMSHWAPGLLVEINEIESELPRFSHSLSINKISEGTVVDH